MIALDFGFVRTTCQRSLITDRNRRKEATAVSEGRPGKQAIDGSSMTSWVLSAVILLILEG